MAYCTRGCPLCTSRRARVFHTLGCGPASWPAPPVATSAENGGQDPRQTSRRRRPTSSLSPKSWWGLPSSIATSWAKWSRPCRWSRQLGSGTQRLLCRGQMRSWTVYIRSGFKYTEQRGAYRQDMRLQKSICFIQTANWQRTGTSCASWKRPGLNPGPWAPERSVLPTALPPRLGVTVHMVDLRDEQDEVSSQALAIPDIHLFLTQILLQHFNMLPK